jgi:hypothetical protein
MREGKENGEEIQERFIAPHIGWKPKHHATGVNSLGKMGTVD